MQSYAVLPATKGAVPFLCFKHVRVRRSLMAVLLTIAVLAAGTTVAVSPASAAIHCSSSVREEILVSISFWAGEMQFWGEFYIADWTAGDYAAAALDKQNFETAGDMMLAAKADLMAYRRQCPG